MSENEFTYLLQTVFSVCGGELKSPDFLFFLPSSLLMYLFFVFFQFIRPSNMLYQRGCLKTEYLFLPF